jgi:hypothetical protein
MISAQAMFVTTLSRRSAGWGYIRAMLALAAVLATTACIGKSAPLEPTSGPLRFTGGISTVDGSPIAGARLTVQDGANLGAEVISDSSGRYVFTSLESGWFTVHIAAPGFLSVNPLINLYTNLDADFSLRKAP